MEGLKSLFLKAYSNLPTDERSQIIVLIEDKPYTWDRAYDEIQGKTKSGGQILKNLKKLGII